MLCSISIYTLIISVNNRHEIATKKHRKQRERERERERNAGTNASVKLVTKVQFLSYTAIRFGVKSEYLWPESCEFSARIRVSVRV
jgi:hypothetical protein